MVTQRRHLGEILYKAGLVQKEAIADAIKVAKSTNKRFEQVLLEKGLVNEDILAKAIAKQFNLEYVNLDKVTVPSNATKLIPEEIIKKHNILPLGMNNGRVKVLISDPLDTVMMDAIRFRLNIEPECCVGNPTKIQTYIKNNFNHVQQEQQQQQQQQQPQQQQQQPQDDRLRHSIDATAAELADIGNQLQEEVARAQAAGESDSAPIIRLVNLIIDNAYHIRASDIHVEPMADRVRIRYRVDGVCMEKDNIPKNMQAQLVTRFKILAGMDIAEKRLPQDGRIKREIDGTDIDFRVSSLPGVHGPSVVLRILRPDAVNIGLGAIGFEHDNYEQFQKIIRRPNGIFLVTGPTGSGKTTTLYAALQELNKPDKKIITAEDPVEYNFAGMNQCQVKDDIGLSFDKILRAMLRQAPNIILVGEIRDGIVADIAIQAALTGHLVFSTLHTNDAPSAITRLIDMGVKPFLVASSIQAIMAQRLIRVICKKCRVVDEHPDPKLLAALKISPETLKTTPVYKGAGCSTCSNTGYKGRIAIFEMFEMNAEIRELAFAKAPTTELRKAARAGGMRTLAEDGRLKIFNGVTTLDEVVSTAQTEAQTD
jgi:type IV pilus assembly protein PilB